MAHSQLPAQEYVLPDGKLLTSLGGCKPRTGKICLSNKEKPLGTTYIDRPGVADLVLQRYIDIGPCTKLHGLCKCHERGYSRERAVLKR